MLPNTWRARIGIFRWSRAIRTEETVKRVVIYRLGSLGDTIIALPFFNRIAALYADHERILLTNMLAPSTAALAVSPLSVLGVGKSVHSALAYPLATRSPGELWDLHRRLRKLSAADMIYLMSPPRGWSQVRRDFLYFKSCGFRRIIGLPITSDLRTTLFDPVTGLEEPEVERLARVLRPLGPIDLKDESNWDLYLDPAEITLGEMMLECFNRRPYIAISMGGKVKQKHWGEDNWRQLLRRLSKHYGEFGLLAVGAGVEAARVNSVTSEWPGPVVNSCGKLAPRESAAVLRRAKVFIGHDSGPLHLAAVVGVRCVGLFGDFHRPRQWHPYIGEHRIIHEMKGVTDITVNQVVAAVQSLMSTRPL